MLTYTVTLRSGHRYTLRAQEMRPNALFHYEFLVPSSERADDPDAPKQVVAAFAGTDVLTVVAKEFFVSELPPVPAPHVVGGDDGIPF